MLRPVKTRSPGVNGSYRRRVDGIAIRCAMAQRKVLRRRKLALSVRKRVTSYYDEKEKSEIAAAAATEGVSLSSFIASVALKEARRINSQK
jgi:hypothetical protein